jgi:hypothetical protein
VTVWGALAGGAVGAAGFTVLLELSQAAGLTRIDLPVLLGSVFVERRDRARGLGYALQLGLFLLAALVYAGVFAAVGRAGWLFGLALGVVHGLLVSGPLTNVVLPAVHPRMGSSWTDASETPLLEPPGFLLANYGRATLAITMLLYIGFGAVVGGFAAGL